MGCCEFGYLWRRQLRKNRALWQARIATQRAGFILILQAFYLEMFCMHVGSGEGGMCTIRLTLNREVCYFCAGIPINDTTVKSNCKAIV